MGVDALLYSTGNCRFPDDLPEPAPAHPFFAVAYKEEGAAASFHYERSCLLHVAAYSFSCCVIKGNHPFLAALAHDSNMAVSQIAAGNRQADQFGDPESCSVEKVDHGIITQTQVGFFFAGAK